MGLMNPFDNPSQITNFNIEVLIQEQILWFNIPMDKVEVMKVLNCGKGLCEEDGGLFLSENFLDILIVEQVPLFGIFHDHVDLGILPQSLPKPNNMRVTNFTVEGNLTLEGLLGCLRQGLTGVYLNYNCFTILIAQALFVCKCKASLTSPKDPFPSLFWSKNSNQDMDLKQVLFASLSIQKFDSKFNYLNQQKDSESISSDYTMPLPPNQELISTSCLTLKSIIAQLQLFISLSLKQIKMKEEYDINILQSIRSEDSDESEKESNRVDNKKNANGIKINLLDDRQTEIRDTLNFGDSIYENKGKNNDKSHGKEMKMEWRKSSGSSDWNDTDEIIKQSQKKEQKDRSEQKRKVVKSRQKGKEPVKQIKYPQILFPSQKSPNKFESEKKLKIKDKPNLNLNLQDCFDDEMIDINVSMIGERKSPAFNHIKKEQVKPIKVPQKVEQKEPASNAFQSVYLSNPKKQEARTDVVMKVMDNTMYWVHDNKQMKISSETFEALVEQFFKKEIMLPLISDSQFKSEHIPIYVQVYTDFLNDFFPIQFKSIFAALKSTFQSGSKYQPGSNPLTPRSSQASLFKNLFDNYVPGFLKGSGYSKSELLRNFMIKKLSMLNYLQKIQKEKQSQQHMVLEDKKKQIQYSIAVLELLVSFENSQNYCKNNSKEGIDHGIWKEHGKKLNQLRKKWVSKIESKNDFSFKI